MTRATPRAAQRFTERGVRVARPHDRPDEAPSRLGLWSAGEKEFGDRGRRHVHFALSVSRGGLAAIAERLGQLGPSSRVPGQHEGGDESLYFEDPEGNVVERWDFFEFGDGACNGVAALR